MDTDKKRIWIRGQYVEVTDEVYAAYMRGDRKMRYFENDLKTERFVLGKEGQVVQIIPSREDSLDRLEDENAQQFSDEQESVESMVLIGELPGIFIHQPVQRIFAAGDDLHHLALLSVNEPFGFQIVLKIAHFPVALHIGR